MKVDLYTKIVLTAIAIGLFLNVAGDSKLSVVRDAAADVAGMDWSKLTRDFQFRYAVEHIIKSPSISYYWETILKRKLKKTGRRSDIRDAVEDIIEGCYATEDGDIFCQKVVLKKRK